MFSGERYIGTAIRRALDTQHLHDAERRDQQKCCVWGERRFAKLKSKSFQAEPLENRNQNAGNLCKQTFSFYFCQFPERNAQIMHSSRLDSVRYPPAQMI